MEKKYFFGVNVRRGRAWTLTIIALALLVMASCGSGSKSGGMSLDKPESGGLLMDDPAGQAGLAEQGDSPRQASSLSWGAPVTVDSKSGTVPYGNCTSLAIVNGNPAMCYAALGIGTHPRALCYVRASNPGGTSWASKKTLATFSAGAPPLWVSLAVVNGNPAACFPGNGLRFTRAMDANGTKWGALQTIDETYYFPNNIGRQSLAYINGRPAVAYNNPGTGELKFVCANDANGTSWGAPQVLESGANFHFPCLISVNGKPAVCYSQHGSDADPTAFELHYIRALDANGTVWSSPQTVISDYTPGSYYPIPYRPSMAIVSSYPAICFSKAYDSNGSYCDQCFVRATDGDGSAWGAEVTLVDAGGSTSTGTASSGILAVINGVPTVTYRHRVGDPTTGVNTLNYIQATASDGSAWGAPLPIASVNALNPCLVPLAGSGAGVAYHDVNLATENFIRGQ